LCGAFGVTERERLDALLADFKQLKNFKPMETG
jgi:hypothetical protein